jgi:hypothetical protein
MGARNLTMAYRRARSTRGGERPKSGEGDLGLPMKFCRVRGLGKLHGPLAELTEALTWLGGDWSGLATAAEALKAWRAVARRARGDFRWSLTWASLESARGWMTEAWGGFIGTTWCTGGHGPASARGLALGGAGARTGVNRRCQPRSNTCARCLYPSSSAGWVQIFANLGKIVVKDLFT